jgi:hypothetical protein
MHFASDVVMGGILGAVVLVIVHRALLLGLDDLRSGATGHAKLPPPERAVRLSEIEPTEDPDPQRSFDPVTSPEAMRTPGSSRQEVSS